MFDLPAPDLSSTKLGARLEHSLDVVGDKLSQFGTTVVDKAQSVLGKFETSINSSVMLAGQSDPSPVNVKVNLDGREMAAALYDPLIKEGKRSGKSLYQN